MYINTVLTLNFGVTDYKRSYSLCMKEGWTELMATRPAFSIGDGDKNTF